DLILRFYWDNETLPSVEVPFGDFFCNGWKMNMNIVSIPINTNPTGGMNCYFPMPFKKHAKVTVENRSAKALPLFAYAISLETGPSDESEGYFHAQFRRSNPLEYGKDHIILNNVRGEGHYAGTHMCWQQNTEGWWGEGEMKAFIDGDKEFPTYCGTGTEDYFGGAWGFNGNYSAPFLGYMDLKAKDGRPTNNVGNRHNLYRFHILDPIRFKEDFKMTIQAIGWRSENRYHPLQDDISSVAYWYMTEPFTDFPILPGRDQLEVI
ncbi:MAG: glycoside hydrolase family 172 protein, partial [Clostridia bacterium]